MVDECPLHRKQNLAALNLKAAQLTAVDAALSTLETKLSGLVALAPGMKRRLMQRDGFRKNLGTRFVKGRRVVAQGKVAA